MLGRTPVGALRRHMPCVPLYPDGDAIADVGAFYAFPRILKYEWLLLLAAVFAVVLTLVGAAGGDAAVMWAATAMASVTAVGNLAHPHVVAALQRR